MDRSVRLFNPYVPSRPIAHFKQHGAPIFYIHLSNEDNRIFTMSTDKFLIVWDLIDHSCLASIRPKTHKITGELQACCYNHKTKTLLINTDKVSFLSLKTKNSLHTEVIISHKEQITCCMYNKEFKQLVSCSEAGVTIIFFIKTIFFYHFF
jgi:WD40 repeat protein